MSSKIMVGTGVTYFFNVVLSYSMACSSLLRIPCTLLVGSNNVIWSRQLTDVSTRVCRILWPIFNFRELCCAFRQHRWPCSSIRFFAILRKSSCVPILYW